MKNIVPNGSYLLDLCSIKAVTLLAITIFMEAEGEPVEGQIAVGCVIRNRVKAKKGFTYADVILAPKQFSSWNDPKRGLDIYRNPHALSKAQREILTQCNHIAQGILTDAILDNVHGADHYLNKTIFNRVKWAAKMKKVKIIGNHMFLKAA